MKMPRIIQRHFNRYPIQRIATRSLRSVISPLLLWATGNRAYDLRHSVVIAGSPRSGTTWLAELLNSIPRSAILFEPEHVKEVRAARAVLQWHAMRWPEETWPEGEAFFARVLRGQMITPWTASHCRLRRAIRPDCWLIKMIDANLYLGWLAAKFPLRAAILLIRNPLAVIASQWRNGWLAKSPPRIPRFEQAFPHFRAQLEALQTPEEYAAAMWCIQQIVPLASAEKTAVETLIYEELAQQPQACISRLVHQWGLPEIRSTLIRADKPSQTAQKDSSIAKESTPGWTKVLSPAQAESISQVVRGFGMNFYDQTGQFQRVLFEQFLAQVRSWRTGEDLSKTTMVAGSV